MIEELEEQRLDTGLPFWVEGHYVCLYDDQGNILGHLGIQREVTPYKRLEALITQRERYLAVVLAIQQQLLASEYILRPTGLGAESSFQDMAWGGDRLYSSGPRAMARVDRFTTAFCNSWARQQGLRGFTYLKIMASG